MFEKIPAARMNNGEGCSKQQLIAGARAFRTNQASRDVSVRFPSYLRLFDNFFRLLICELPWGAAGLPAFCCGRFPMAGPYVAFL